MKDKIALVTGGSRGIGKAISIALARRGVKVYINFRKREDAAQETKQEIEDAGGRCVLVKADVSKEGDIASMIQTIQENEGGLDILISNAVTGVLKPVTEITASEWDYVFKVNTISLMLLTQKALPLMEGREFGRIVSLTSHGSTRAYPQYGIIGISKAALETMSRYLAAELGPKNITVNTLCGGTVATDAIKNFPNLEKLLANITRQTPMGKLTEPNDIGETVAFLCSREAGMITGQNIVVDGGYSVH